MVGCRGQTGFEIEKDSIYRIDDIPEDTFDFILFNTSLRSRGILILLPNEFTSKTWKRLSELESVFLERSTSVPIFFAFEDDELLNVLHRSRSTASSKLRKTFF